MAWSGPSFAHHNGSLNPHEAAHAARIANAVLRRSGDEGLAVAVANKHYQHLDDGGAVEPPDMTNHYNTQLSPEQEAAFQRTPHASDVFDYDARGEFLSGQNRDNPTGHGADTFKKPNHPTFSTGSQYHGVDGHQGGVWSGGQNGAPWTFTPSATNLRMHDAGDLHRYFQEQEQGNRLMLPERAWGGIVRRDDGGGIVDPSTSGIGGLTPSADTMNPIMRGMVQRYSSLSPEKLQEMAAMMGGSPQGQVIQRVLAQKRSQPPPIARPQQAAVAPNFQPAALPTPQRRGGATPRRRAPGGMLGVPMGDASPWWTRQQSRQEDSGSGANGFLHGSTPGRADEILTTAPAGSHVIPADVIAGLGEGNSLAGARVMDQIIRSGPGGIPMPAGGRGHGAPHPPAPFHQARGGETPEQTPVALSHGEYVVQPHHVEAWGDRDAKTGHAVFDHFIVNMRKQIIATMKKLPGPVKDGRK